MIELESLVISTITRVPPVPVFPVRLDKGPFPGFRWRSLASTDLEQLRRWCTEYPEHRWAVPGGKASGLLFLDLDSLKAISASEHLGLNGGEVRPTLTPEHGRVTFAWQGEEGCWNARTRNSVALDIKAEGGYCVIYEEIPSVIPAPPAWLLALCRDEWLRKDVDGSSIQEGSRNSTLTSLAGKMRVRGLGEEEIAMRLRIINEFRCDPPMAEREVAGIAKSVGSYAAGGTTSPRSRAPPAPTAFQADAGANTALFDDKGQPEPLAFATYLASLGPFACPQDTFTATSCELFRYQDGVYKDDGRPFVHRVIEREFRNAGRIATVEFAEGLTKAIARDSMVSRQAFNPAGLLSMRNGVLDVTTRALKPHDPLTIFTRQLPYDYDANAACPTFKRFLSDVLPPDEERREVQKFFGDFFEAGNPYQAAAMFVGAGDNGKSTLLGAAVDMLGGADNVAAESLQSLAENRFASANLFGKLACIYADLPDTPLRYSGMFKMLTGGDLVRGEGKFLKAFYFRNDAKLVFSCNKLPEVNDKTFAFWRRWLLFKFEVSFAGREDRDLPGKLRAELPGVLNWALDGLRLLREDVGFRPGLTSAALMEEWRRRSDSVYWFTAESVEPDPGIQIRRDGLYEHYRDFCDEHTLSPKNHEAFAKEIRNQVPQVRPERPRIGEGGKQVSVWTGIRLKPAVHCSHNPPCSTEALHPRERGERATPTLSAYAEEPDNPNGGVPYIPGERT